MKYTIIVDGDVFEVEVGPGGQAWVNGRLCEVDLRHVGGRQSAQSSGEYSLLIDHRSYEIHAADSDIVAGWMTVDGRRYRIRLQHSPGDARRPVDHGADGARGDARAEAVGQDRVAALGLVPHVEMRAPLPGLLVELRVRQGEQVAEQQVVAVLESMKMNLEVRAPRAGVVHELCVAPGRQVAQDEVLAVLSAVGDG